MAIAILHRTLSRTLLTFGIMSLVGCGGGGGGGEKKPAPDSTPNTFSYTAISNAEPSSVITSTAVTIAGINMAAPVSITGGEYSINSGAFTSAAGTVTSGQTITVRLTTPAANSTSASAQLNVGGVAGTFTVTTKADTTPDTFSFTAQTNAALNTEYTSNTITVAGIDTAVPVSITGGTYSINGGAFTAAAGTVSVNNTVVVKGISTSESESTHNVVLTIGGVSATYAITTVADTTPPVAEFKFPTPYTMSEAMSVKVRGTATDDHAITSVKVVVNGTPVEATPKSETNGVKDFSSWTATVLLTALAENEIKVVATDDRNNSIAVEGANKVVVRQADVKNAFPDDINEFEDPRYSAFDMSNGDGRLLVAQRGRVSSVDINTGLRSTFIDHADECSGALNGIIIDNVDSRIYGMCDWDLYEFDLSNTNFVSKYIVPNPQENLFRGITLDRTNSRKQLVLAEHVSEYDNVGGRLLGFSLDSKQFSVISTNSEQSLLLGATAIAILGDNYLVTAGSQHDDANLHRIVNVAAAAGKQTVYSDNTIGSGVRFSALLADQRTAALSGIVVDKQNNRVLVMESLSGKLISVDIATGERRLVRDVSYLTDNVTYTSFLDMDLDESRGILALADSVRDAIIIIDLETGEKVILSKSKNSY